MSKKNKNKKDFIKSIILIVWFFGSLIAMWISSEINREDVLMIIVIQYFVVFAMIFIIDSIKKRKKKPSKIEHKNKKQIIKRKPMSSVGVKGNIIGIAMSSFALLLIIFDNEAPMDIKIFTSCIFLPIIIICTTSLILDYNLKRNWTKYNKKLVPEKEKIISAEEWNNYQGIYSFPGERTIYSDKINKILGEKRTFIIKTDKYGNTVLQNRNDNLFDWIILFVFANTMNIMSLIAFIYNQTNIISLLVVFLIFIPVVIWSFLQIKRIKKLNLEIKNFQFIKLIFFLLIFIIISVAMLLMFKNFK